MKPPIVQRDLPVAGEVFNLASETGVDPDRLVRERLQAATDAAEARIYQLRMQRTFAQCPGFIGGDLPDGELRRGVVRVEPSKAAEAAVWLKRRFSVNPEVRLADAFGIEIEFVTRSKVRLLPGQKRRRISFEKPQQFTLDLSV